MNACSTGSGPKRVKSAPGAFVRSALIHATLCSTLLLSQTLEKAIPYASVYSDVDGPLFLAVDSTTNTVYVASDCGEDILAIDGATHRRKANIPFGDEWCCALFSVPGQSRVYCVGETLAAALDTRTNAVIKQFVTPQDDYYVGGGVNPRAGKAYLAYEDSLAIVDALTNRLLGRIQVGWPEVDDYDRMFFASNTANGKVYLVTCDDDETDRLVVVDCAGDSVLARVNLGKDPYVYAMCYDDANNVVWCAVEDTCSVLLGVDGDSDSVVAAVRLDEDPCVIAMCFADDVNKLYLLDDEGYVTSFDAANRRVLGRFWVGDEVTAACVNPREHKLYCGRSEAGLAVYDTRDDSWVGEVGWFEEPMALALNPVANEVWCVDDCLNTATAIHCGCDSVEAVVSTYSRPTAVCLDAGADRLYVSGLDWGLVNVIDANLDTLPAPYEVGFDIYAMCLNPTEHLLFCTNRDSDEVVVLDASTGQLCHRLAATDPKFLVFDSASNRVYCVGGSGESTYTFSGDGSRRLAGFELGMKTQAVFLDPLHHRLYCAADKDKGIGVVDCDGDSVVALLATEAHDKHRVLTGFPERSRLYCGNAHSLSVYDTRTNRPLGLVELGAQPVGVCCDPLTGCVFCAARDSAIAVLDPETDSVVARVAVPARVKVLGCDRASNSVYWVGDSTVGFIDARTLKPAGSLRLAPLWPFAACDGDEGRVYLLGFSSAYIVHNDNPDHYLQSRTGPVLVSRDVFLYGAESASLFDATGRRLMALHPGSNRLVGVPPGAYFLLRSGAARAQKLIITR
jgi:DNA-binding beta-propeller fold protein YncE